MTNYDTQIRTYLEIWNEADDEKRALLARQLFTGDATYIDPLVAAAGPEVIAATIAAVRSQFPGWTFRQVGESDAHNTFERFPWALSPDDSGAPEDAPVIGFDVASLTEDGRIERVTGFLDRVLAT